MSMKSIEIAILYCDKMNIAVLEGRAVSGHGYAFSAPWCARALVPKLESALSVQMLANSAML